MINVVDEMLELEAADAADRSWRDSLLEPAPGADALERDQAAAAGRAEPEEGAEGGDVWGPGKIRAFGD